MNEIELGMIHKAAQLDVLPASEKELDAINKLTLEPLQAGDVFTFKVAMCDNEVDREFEVFPRASLEKMQGLFIGRTMIKDHRRTSDNQIARIYNTELITTEGRFTKAGETYCQLVAHVYTLNNEANKDMIAEIKGGIKKEVSVNVSVKNMICSICGRDNMKSYCEHFWGKEYDGKQCFFSLESPSDAYELSFVAVPAQAQAGTIKALEQEKHKAAKEAAQETGSNDAASDLLLRVKALDVFLFTQNQ